jgi:hypothetical protein
MDTHQRRFIFIAGGIFIALIVVSLLFFFLQSRMGRLIVTLVPNDGTVTVDGKPIAANGTTFVAAGKHTIVAHRDYFVDQKQDFTISSGENKAFSFYLLTGGSGPGLEWLKQHPDQASEIEGYYGQQIEQQSNKLYNNNPILSQLPILDTDFRIDYGLSKKNPKDPQAFALYVQATTQDGRDHALLTLQYFGYDPAKFEIIYVDPKNPQ